MSSEETFTPNLTELHCACAAPLPEMVARGIALFNQQDFFNAHEVLEEAWRAERRPIRELYRAILQIGLAYYHIQRGNYNGALKMFKRSAGWIAPFPPVCHGIDVDRLKQDASLAHQEILSLGPQRLQYFRAGLVRPVIFRASTEAAGPE